MRLKDFLSKPIKNKSSGQFNISLKLRKLKEVGISKEELLNTKIDKPIIDKKKISESTKLLMEEDD